MHRTEGFAVMSGIDMQSRLRMGQLCLPDKEFRYLRHHCYLCLFVRDSGPIISVGLLMSP